MNGHINGMIGPCQCVGGSKVLDTRVMPNGMMWRRRKCNTCKGVFATTEQFTELVRPKDKPRPGRIRNKPAKKLPAVQRVVNTHIRNEEPKPAPIPSIPTEKVNNVVAARKRIEELREARELAKLEASYD